MADIIIETLQDFITGKDMTTGYTWMIDICRKFNSISTPMMNGEAREEIMQAGIEVVGTNEFPVSAKTGDLTDRRAKA
jgi:hypothetical protein